MFGLVALHHKSRTCTAPIQLDTCEGRLRGNYPEVCFEVNRSSAQKDEVMLSSIYSVFIQSNLPKPLLSQSSFLAQPRIILPQPTFAMGLKQSQHVRR